MRKYKVTIIGAGPAGIACASQLNRYGIDCIIIEKSEIGGLLRNANLVENYPGFPDGIKGKELVNLFKTQLKNTGMAVLNENVLKVDYDGNFLINTDKNTYCSDFLVIASGTKPKLLSFADKPELEGKIFYEVDKIENNRDKKFAVIGAGDAAFDYSINLSKNNYITVLNRSRRLKCLPLLYKKVLSINNIRYIENINVIDIKASDNKLVLITDNPEYSRIDADYLLAAIGREPDLDFISDDFMQLLEKLKNKNLFLAGDVKNGIYRQTAISAGDGIKAAMKIYEVINENTG